MYVSVYPRASIFKPFPCARNLEHQSLKPGSQASSLVREASERRGTERTAAGVTASKACNSGTTGPGEIERRCLLS